MPRQNNHSVMLKKGYLGGKTVYMIVEKYENSSSSEGCIGKFSIDRCCQTKATGNGENLSGGIGGGIAGKIADGLCNFFRQAHTSQWNMPQKQISKII